MLHDGANLPLDEIEKYPSRGRKFPSEDHPQVKELAEQIGKHTSAVTIRKRLYLLALPEEVQNAIEHGEIQLKIAMKIARLRQLDDSEFAERKMKELANDPNYRGNEPNREGSSNRSPLPGDTFSRPDSPDCPRDRHDLLPNRTGRGPLLELAVGPKS